MNTYSLCLQVDGGGYGEVVCDFQKSVDVNFVAAAGMILRLSVGAIEFDFSVARIYWIEKDDRFVAVLSQTTEMRGFLDCAKKDPSWKRIR